ncbi:MAG: DNA topoisomerase, partial [Peptostreptococcaceae bacterium]
MAKYLLIAEKPSLMREIQQVYSKMSMTDTIDFASFAGHVIGMKEPREYDNELWQSKKWSWEMLPMIPEKFEYKVSYGKEQLYKEINKKLKATKYDYVINACDPDREAESIFWYFMEHAKCKLPVKRFWTNDLTEVSIKNALNNLRDSEEDFLRNLRTASRLRGQFDWLVGMNLTIASSLKLKSISKVGRVKTPTLKIIADRELEIKNFTPTTTYEVKGVFDASGVAYDGVFIEENTITKFKTKEDAMKILDALSKDCVVESIESKEESSQAPQLYSLSSLQTEASELYGFSAEQTKTSVQTLYEKKILSYPRTDNPYISSELAKEFGKMLSAVYEVKSLSKYKGTITKESMDKVSKNKRYVNDKKMAESGHYAIVPTGMKPNYSIMNKDEELIFEMVAKRFLAIFMP